jgi:hypothetical protein
MALLSRLIFRNSLFGIVRGQVVCRLMSGQSFKTDLHTDNLYPGSNSKDRFSVKKAIPSDHPSGFNGIINIDELQVTLDFSELIDALISLTDIHFSYSFPIALIFLTAINPIEQVENHCFKVTRDNNDLNCPFTTNCFPDFLRHK